MKYLLILGVLFCGLAHANTTGAPRCNPGDYSPTVNWQVGVASDQSIVSILWCNDSTGLQLWAAGWNPAEAPVTSCAGNIRSESAALLMTAFWENCLEGSGTGNLTVPQQTAVTHLVQLWLPKMQAPSQENVYEYTNGVLTNTVEGQLPANSTCHRTVIGTRQGVEFYDVSGLLFTNGSVIPPNSAAVCKLVAPPETGWPQ
jgi:hypothetical protein